MHAGNQNHCGAALFHRLLAMGLNQGCPNGVGSVGLPFIVETTRHFLDVCDVVYALAHELHDVVERDRVHRFRISGGERLENQAIDLPEPVPMIRVVVLEDANIAERHFACRPVLKLDPVGS